MNWQAACYCIPKAERTGRALPESRVVPKMVDDAPYFELKSYEGQPHGFFNPGRGSGEARAEACRYYYKTIAEMDAFLVSLGHLK